MEIQQLKSIMVMLLISILYWAGSVLVCIFYTFLTSLLPNLSFNIDLVFLDPPHGNGADNTWAVDNYLSTYEMLDVLNTAAS